MAKSKGTQPLVKKQTNIEKRSKERRINHYCSIRKNYSSGINNCFFSLYETTEIRKLFVTSL